MLVPSVQAHRWAEVSVSSSPLARWVHILVWSDVANGLYTFGGGGGGSRELKALDIATSLSETGGMIFGSTRQRISVALMDAGCYGN